MNQIQVENITLLIAKLKDDIQSTLNWFKSKNFSTPTLECVYGYIDNDKVDVLFKFEVEYYRHNGFIRSQKIIYDKIQEYKELYPQFRTIYISSILPDRIIDIEI